MMNPHRRKRQGGNTIVEFAVAMAFMAPLLLGTFTVGMNLGRAVQVTSLNSSAGNMYVRWVDFSLTANQDLIVRMAQGLNMTRTGGDGNVILSQVTVVSDADCTAGGLSGSACTNRGQPVIIHRVYIGNKGLRNSAFGNPADALIGTDGKVAQNTYLTDVGVRATNWTSVMTLKTDEVAYVAEAYFISPQFDLSAAMRSGGIYSRFIY